MKLTPIFRAISQFDPTKLPELLSRFEGIIHDALGLLDRDKADSMWFVPIKPATYMVQIGEIVPVDGTDVPIRLPVAHPANAGRCIGVYLLSAACGATLTAPGQLVSGETTESISGTVGVYEWISTGKGWVRRR